MTQINPPFTTPHASLNQPAPSLRLTWRPPRASPRSSPPCCRPGVRMKSNMEGKMFCGLLTRSRSNSSYHRPPTHPEARQPLADALRGLLEALAPALPRVPVLFLANHTHHHVYGSSATDPSPEPKPHPLTPIHNRPHQTNKRTKTYCRPCWRLGGCGVFHDLRRSRAGTPIFSDSFFTQDVACCGGGRR